jgi:dTDP-4-dehydrorhamnose 3,5-epimerase
MENAQFPVVPPVINVSPSFVSSETSLPGVLIIKPRIFSDERGYFLESYNQKGMASLGRFVQDNQSFSRTNVLRGLHYQMAPYGQGKLVRVVQGEILDVAVNMQSGQWTSVLLSDTNQHMLWIPSGFAHGYRVLSYTAHVAYKATDYYAPEYERTVLWNDPYLNIDWEMKRGAPLVSVKDQKGLLFTECQ